MKNINIRRSVRTFKPNIVENDKIEKLLRAGMQAPSAGNQQPWEFIVVTDLEIKKKISKMNSYSIAAKDAPLIISVVANIKRMVFPENMEQDLGACTQNILLEAVELGLGATWMSVYPQEERISHLRGVLNLPDFIVPYNIIIVGYPLNKDANYYIDRYEPKRIHKQVYGVQ